MNCDRQDVAAGQVMDGGITLQAARMRMTIGLDRKLFVRSSVDYRSLAEARLSEERMAGYSGTPLAKKLGIKSRMIIHVVNSPRDYGALVDPLPDDVIFASGAGQELDLVHIFTASRSELIETLIRYQLKIKQNGAIWVSWPKKASGIPSEVNEDTVRDLALPMGLVDTKVCAVDEIWSGLKLVIRKENRK
jgi:hypothetical protein